MEEDLAVEAAVLDQVQWANHHLASRAVEHRPSVNRQGEVSALHLQDLVSRVEVVLASRAEDRRLARHLLDLDLVSRVEAALARHLQDLVSRVEVLRLESHRQVDLEVIKDPNQEEVSR